MQPLFAALLLVSSLVPTRVWYGPNDPLEVQVKSDGPAALVLTDFVGGVLEPTHPANIDGAATVDLKQVFGAVNRPGTYVLYVVPRQEGKEPDLSANFQGTPLVVSVRSDNRRGAPVGPMVTKVEPLRYAVIRTERGPVTVGFFYDAAPHTVSHVLRLADEGFYDGLTFHRIVPGFLIQGGDPRGDGTGGPGFSIDAEFSDRPFTEGVLGMARAVDPLEPAAPPRKEFADTAGSQFFITLGDQAKTRTMDRRYTAFGRVVGGMEAVRQLAERPIANTALGRPRQPPVIQKIEIKLVTAGDNPYTEILRAPEVLIPDRNNLTAGNAPAAGAATMPTTNPAEAQRNRNRSVQGLSDDKSSQARPGELQQGGNAPRPRPAPPPPPPPGQNPPPVR